MTGARVTPLAYRDEPLAALDLPGGRLEVTRGIGSGLTRRHDDPAGTIWAVGDRGPNLKVPLLIERYGVADLADHADVEGAKVMPFPAIGPGLAELRVDGDCVTLVRSLPLRTPAGATLTGLPPAGSDARRAEPALALDGTRLAPDPSGADTEGLAPAPDGGFWVGEEYGPSLLRVDPAGTVLTRWVPAGTEDLFAGAQPAPQGCLPAIAARRRLNRGFEGLGASPDGRWLYLAFQSPLAHPDADATKKARHVRILKLDAATGEATAQFAYPLDDPDSFRRDGERKKVKRRDLKLCDIAVAGEDRLLLLERATLTAKVYAVTLTPDHALPPEQLDADTRPTLEEASHAGDAPWPVLSKLQLLSTDDHPEVSADLEGLVLLDDRTLLLVNDNDFGIEGVPTRFWRVDLPAPVA